jgi:hypothetical protein
MFKRVGSRLDYANVISTLALFLALGGGAYATAKLAKNSVGGREIKKNAVGAAEIKKGAVRSSEVKDRSLLASDFRTGQLPAGPTGVHGPQGIPGTARAYALVVDTTDGTANFSRSKNVVQITHPGGGLFCIQLAASIDPATAGVIATPTNQDFFENSGGSYVQPRAAWDPTGAGCPANTLAVHTYEDNDSGDSSDHYPETSQNDQQFFFVVP